VHIKGAAGACLQTAFGELYVCMSVRLSHSCSLLKLLDGTSSPTS